MKKVFTRINSLVLTILSVTLFTLLVVSCETNQANPPKFEGLVNGYLPPMTVNVKDTKVDFLANVKATSDSGKVEITVDMNDYNNKVIGTYTVKYTAVDLENSLTTTVERKVSVIDSIAPIFTNSDNNSQLPEVSCLQYDTKFDLLNNSNGVLDIRDNYDTEEIKAYVKDNGGFDVEKAGVYTITYAAKDSSNNESTVTRKVTVKEAVKWVEDVISINEMQNAVLYNDTTAFEKDVNEGAKLRALDQCQLMTKDFYLSELESHKEEWANNGGVPFLPYCVVVVLDKDMKPVRVRNATYAVEAIKEDGKWTLLKNGNMEIGGELVPVTVTFIDGDKPSAKGVGIMGGKFEESIPDDGYVLIGSAAKGGKLDLGKIMILQNTIAKDFTGGALSWDLVEATGTTLLETAQFKYEKDVVTLYEKPAPMATPVLKVEKHVLSWDKVEGADHYELYVNGELKQVLTATSIRMTDLGLEPSLEGEHYEITVKAISGDIRFHTDSALSEVLEYVMPDAKQIPAITTVELNGTVISWEEAVGSVKYEIYAKQTGNEMKIGETTETSFDLAGNSVLAKLTYKAFIFVKAIGDDTETLTSDASNNVVYNCTPEKVITFGDGIKYEVLETTAKDYFGTQEGATTTRRNDSSEVGYAEKQLFFLIVDASSIKASDVEAFGFLVVFDKDGAVKHMINVLATTKQYINYKLVDAASCGYKSNNAQLAPLLEAGLAEGDTLLIGRTTGNYDLGTFTGLKCRDILAHYFWAPATTNANGQSWRNEQSIEDFPKYQIKLANSNELEAPILSTDGSMLKWNQVEGATSYDVYVNNVIATSTAETSIDLMKYVDVIGRSGAAAVNYTKLSVQVIAKADGKTDGVATSDCTITTTLTDGTNTMNVTYNLQNSLWNSGSGINIRFNDLVSTVMTGQTYKTAFETYKNSNSKNGGTPFMQNGIIVIMDKDMKVKVVRFGYVNCVEISGDNEYKTTELTWNNSGQSDTNPGGTFLKLETEVLDTDVVLIVANVDSKAQITTAVTMFVDTNAADVVAKKLVPSEASTTKVVLANAKYELKAVAALA